MENSPSLLKIMDNVQVKYGSCVKRDSQKADMSAKTLNHPPLLTSYFGKTRRNLSNQYIEQELIKNKSYYMNFKHIILFMKSYYCYFNA